MSTEVEYTEKNVVSIEIKIEGDAVVIINGDPITAEGADTKSIENIVTMALDYEGDVLVTVNGEDFHTDERKPKDG